MANVIFTAGTTTTVTDFTLSGTAGDLVSISSSSPGTQFTLSKASGAVVVNYLSIQDSNATGGATWSALNSSNVSNNSGWTFGAVAPSYAVTGQFMAFF
jgi:hypothetical protein